MPGPKRGYTTPHRCATVDSLRRNQPSDRDRQARQKLQEKMSDFQVTFDDCVYLSLGPAKRDIYNKPFNIHLDPPSTEQPPLVEIKQEGKVSVYTTDFYFTNKLPSNIAVWPQGQNNNTSTADQVATADPTLFDTAPLQPGEICLHSWMLYTSQAPVLDLTGEHIKTKEDIKATFHTLHLCPQEEGEQSLMAEKKEEPANQSKFLTGSDSSDDIKVNPRFKTSVEERQYNTIPGSVTATHIALSHSRVQVNPTVE